MTSVMTRPRFEQQDLFTDGPDEMPRIRTIKPEFFESTTVAKLSKPARLLFIACLNWSDDSGNVRWNCAYLKGVCFPYDDDTTASHVAGWMDEIADVKLVTPYFAEGDHYAHITGFAKHQVIKNPSKPKHPKPGPNPGLPQDYPRANSKRRMETETETETETEGKRKGNGNGNGNGNGAWKHSYVDSEIDECVSVDPVYVFEYWNSHTEEPVARCRSLTKTRITKLKSRLKETAFLNAWRDAIGKLPIENTKDFDWQPTFDWLIANDTNAVSLAEGKYDRATGSQNEMRSLKAKFDRIDLK